MFCFASGVFEAELRKIDESAPKLIERVRQLAEINSGTDHLAGLARMEAELIAEVKSFADDVRTIDLPPASTIDSRGSTVERSLGRAILATKRPDAPLRVLLNIHYDTVYGENDPFQRVEMIDATTMRGPGVADAKGGIVTMLAALRALESSPLAKRIGWEVLLNPDEEIGSPGSAAIIAEAAKRNHLALVFEPAFSDGALVDARKGSGTITAIVRGRAAHSGRDFAAGRSAIVALAILVIRLEAAQVGQIGITINCGRIEGGAATNIVPDLAIGRFNVRATTPQDMRLIDEIFTKAADEVRRRDGISVELHGGFNSPPKPFDAVSAKLMDYLIACGDELGLSLSHRPSGGVSDGNKIAVAAGIPVIDSLGPVGGDLHSDREFMRTDTLPQRAKLVALLLLKLAAGEISL